MLFGFSWAVEYAHEEPTPSGRVVRQECIEPLGLTVTEAAKRLGVTRQVDKLFGNELR